MNILLITYSYSPDLTPRAFRWAALADQLAQRGHKVHVLCAASLGAAPEVVTKGVWVHRVRDWLINASGRVAPGGTPKGTPTRGGWRVVWRSSLKKFARTIWRATHWPDYACGWILPATARARELCRATQFDWVISVSHPFSGHMVGWLIRKHAREARWFVDIGDPFCLMDEPAPNNRRLYAFLNRWMESKILAGANAISVTTESTQELYETHFLGVHGKVHLIPPLLSLPESPTPSPRTSDEPRRLVFVGTLYRQLRSPSFLLSCFSALKQVLCEAHSDLRVELHFYGALNDCAEELAACSPEVRDTVIVHGLVGRAEVLQAMLDADVLVNIGNDSEAQLASKVIEYMAVGKPILNLVSLERDTSVAALADYPAALTLARSEGLPPAIVATLREFVLTPPAVPAAVAAAVRERYSAFRVADDYEAILNSMSLKP